MKKVEKMVAIVDTREQTPFNLEQWGLQSTVGTLKFGDYSLLFPDLRDLVIIERKSLADFVACCGQERERFEKEIIALRGYRYKAIVVEASIKDVQTHAYQSKILPQCVIGSIAKWTREGIPSWFCDDRYTASYFVASFLCGIGREIIQYATSCYDLSAPDIMESIKIEKPKPLKKKDATRFQIRPKKP